MENAAIPQQQDLQGLQSVYVIDQNKDIRSGDDALEQLVKKVPIISSTPGTGEGGGDDDARASLLDGLNTGGMPVYVLTPPHQCTCGSSDCTPELNQTKLRQILTLKRLLENGHDIKSLLQRTSEGSVSQSQVSNTDKVSKHDLDDGKTCIKSEEKSRTFKNKKTRKHKEGKKKHHCNDCTRKFRSQESLDEHLKLHAGGNSDKCELCLKLFDNRRHLKKHVKKKHDLNYQEMVRGEDEIQELRSNKKYECQICSKSFKKVNNYVLHMVAHNEKRPHACNQCGKSFKMAGNLSIHKKYCGKPRQVHQCRFCERQFKGQFQCAEHERTHTNERPFQCKFCSKSFKTQQHVKNHERIHTGETPYECRDCGKRFKSAATFACHKRQHDAKFPHVCEHCGKGFQIRRLLEEHLRTHTGERPFPCPHCEKDFALKRTLVVHLRTHTGYKPWICDQCGKQFATSGRLKEHTRIHTGEKPFACTQCPKRFVQWQQLRAHKKTHQRTPEIIEALESVAVRQLAASLGSSLTSASNASEGSLTVAQVQTTVLEKNVVSMTTCDEIQIIPAVQVQHGENVEADQLVLQTGAESTQVTEQAVQLAYSVEQTEPDPSHQLTHEAVEVARALEGLTAECKAIAATGGTFQTRGENIQIVLNCEDNQTVHITGMTGHHANTENGQLTSSNLFPPS